MSVAGVEEENTAIRVKLFLNKISQIGNDNIFHVTCSYYTLNQIHCYLSKLSFNSPSHIAAS